MTGSRLVSAIGLGVWMLAAAHPLARAADANELVKQGIELRRHGQDAAALKLFEQAYQTDQSPRIVAQMGLAEQALGRWVPSFEHLRKALGATTDPWIVKNRGAIAPAHERVSEHVGLLDVTEGPPGAEIRLDGIKRGTLPLPEPLAVTLGPVVIELSAAGYAPVQRTTTIRARETIRESFDGALRPLPKPAVAAAPVAAATEPAPPPAPQTPTVSTGAPEADVVTAAPGPTSMRLPLVLAAGGVAAAGLVFGVIEHLVWQRDASSFEDMPGCGAEETDRGTVGCKSLYDSGNRARTLAFVGYGVAAVGAATAAILYFNLAAPNHEGRQVACTLNPFAVNLGCAVRF